MKLKYGNGYLDLNIERIDSWEILSNEFESTSNLEHEARYVLQNPLGSKRLKDIVKRGDSICIVISDITRAYQKMSLWLPYIVEELEIAGVEDRDILFLSSTGAHRKQTREEHEILLGEELSKRFEVVDHDSFDENSLVLLGYTTYGTEVRINRAALECDHLVITGAVTFHDMAGYGGGRKSILPGISSYRAVMENHSKVLSSVEGGGINSQCRLGNIENNPMHLDMMEACEKLDIAFAFNVILDNDGNVYKAVAGDYRKVHEMGREYCDDIGVVHIKERADIVIASAGGYPKDINLYQASKVFSVCAEALKEGGTMIVVAECIENMGSDESVDIIMDYEDNLQREMEMRRQFSPEAYSGYLICELAKKYNIILVSGYENEEEIGKSGVMLVRSIDKALDIAYKDIGNAFTYIMPNAMSVLPKMKTKRQFNNA